MYFKHASIHLSSDYRSIPRLDTYEAANLDPEDYEALSPGARAEVERQLKRRDRQEALASGRMRPGLLYDEGSDEGEDTAPPTFKRRRMGGEDEGMDFDMVGRDYFAPPLEMSP